ncbi:YheT family hydrolase [Fulvivirga lutea]|uniref:Alpha/beta fold hydrolase n=1 Tax=Fulvivirga lutea TaxID=2810512 RepID=A0A974WEU8_9BACT|nr:alpha/beta fold hydrolase [Fulvivirga lutea]QSE96615.1 alpha/beta fold hydrolase [Fulvivirga lutea]
MPLVKSSYKPPFWMRNGHIATIVPSTFRKVEGVTYSRERIDTPDDDFLDLDWIKRGNDQLVIISHGLEGSSNRPYMLGMAKYMSENGVDVLAWNCRSCSGEINRQARFYHHGATDDLETVVNHVLCQLNYKSIVLIGFSMGGSLTIKYLGENDSRPKEVKGGIAFSIPVSLKSSVDQLTHSKTGFYKKRFLRKLEEKVKLKAETYPGLIEYDGFKDIKEFEDFDNKYTAPIHGFKDAQDFYKRASAGNYLPQVSVPLLICNAVNDPFLGEPCYPYGLCELSENLYLETPKYGGHVGFQLPNADYNYMEKRALEFIKEQF